MASPFILGVLGGVKQPPRRTLKPPPGVPIGTRASPRFHEMQRTGNPRQFWVSSWHLSKSRETCVVTRFSLIVSPRTPAPSRFPASFRFLLKKRTRKPSIYGVFWLSGLPQFQRGRGNIQRGYSFFYLRAAWQPLQPVGCFYINSLLLDIPVIVIHINSID